MIFTYSLTLRYAKRFFCLINWWEVWCDNWCLRFYYNIYIIIILFKIYIIKIYNKLKRNTKCIFKFLIFVCFCFTSPRHVLTFHLNLDGAPLTIILFTTLILLEFLDAIFFKVILAIVYTNWRYNEYLYKLIYTITIKMLQSLYTISC